MGRKKKKGLKPWCFYCQREFEDEMVLVNHQKAKHFKCHKCNRRLVTGPSLMTHMARVHKETVHVIPNAIPGREDPKLDIFGSQGVPEWALDEYMAFRSGLPPPKRAKRAEDSFAGAGASDSGAIAAVAAGSVSSSASAVPSAQAPPMPAPPTTYSMPPPQHSSMHYPPPPPWAVAPSMIPPQSTWRPPPPAYPPPYSSRPGTIPQYGGWPPPQPLMGDPSFRSQPQESWPRAAATDSSTATTAAAHNSNSIPATGTRAGTASAPAPVSISSSMLRPLAPALNKAAASSSTSDTVGAPALPTAVATEAVVSTDCASSTSHTACPSVKSISSTAYAAAVKTSASHITSAPIDLMTASAADVVGAAASAGASVAHEAPPMVKKRIIHPDNIKLSLEEMRARLPRYRLP